MAEYHSFNVEMATDYGIPAAVLFYHIAFWVDKNEADGTHFNDGKYWTYSSIAAMAKLFPYMSEKTIRNALQKLCDEGIVEVGNYNQLAYDRKKWYALTDKGRTIWQKGQIHLVKRANGFGKKGKPITDNTTDIYKKEIYKERNSKPAETKESQKKTYGTFGNVRLTDAEYEKLQATFKDYERWIDTLSVYIASKGDKYKSHYATILNWYRRENGGKPNVEKEYF